MKKRAISLLLAGALTVMSLAGCSDSSAAEETTTANNTAEEEAADSSAEDTADEKEDAGDTAADSNAEAVDGTQITFWHSMSGTNGEALEALVDQFNAENTDGITVVSEFQGEYDDSINKLKSSSLGNLEADVVQIYDIGTRYMIDSGLIIKMQDLIDANGFDISGLEENIMAYYSIDGDLYSMPFNSSTPILYYNVEAFEEAGITEIPANLEEILEISEELVENSSVTNSITLGVYGWFFEQFLNKMGEHYVDNNNGRGDTPAEKVVFEESGAGLKIFEAWNDLNESGYSPYVGDSDAALAEFMAGTSAIALGSTASLSSILSNVGDSFEVGTAYYPSISAGDEGGVSIGGASLWALDNQDDAKATAAWKFIEFLVSPPVQAQWHVTTGYFPVVTASHEEEVYLSNLEEYPQFQTAIDQLHDSAPEYAGALLSVFTESRTIIEQQIQNVVNGLATPEEAIEEAAGQINSSIEDYNFLNE